MPVTGSFGSCAVFDRSGLWLVGGTSGTSVMVVDPATHKASIVIGYGPGFSQSLAADDARVWTTHFSGNPARLDLARIDLDHPVKVTAGIPTAQVAEAAARCGSRATRRA